MGSLGEVGTGQHKESTGYEVREPGRSSGSVPTSGATLGKSLKVLNLDFLIHNVEVQILGLPALRDSWATQDHK